MTGSAPDALVLVCDPRRAQIETYPTPTLRYRESIAIHEALLETVKPAKVIGIALNTQGIAEREARAELERARDETGLPAADLVRFGALDFYAAIAPGIVKRPARTRGRTVVERVPPGRRGARACSTRLQLRATGRAEPRRAQRVDDTGSPASR